MTRVACHWIGRKGDWGARGESCGLKAIAGRLTGWIGSSSLDVITWKLGGGTGRTERGTWGREKRKLEWRQWGIFPFLQSFIVLIKVPNNIRL